MIIEIVSKIFRRSRPNRRWWVVAVGKKCSLLLLLLFLVQPSSAQFNRANQIYSSAVRATVLIVSDGEASGVLIDKNSKLVVTNAHVTDREPRVDVIFPVFRNGEVIGSRKYYRDNEEILRDLKHHVSGRVIVEDVRSDIAIIQLDSVPESAVELAKRRHCNDMNEGDAIHIIGRSELGLWRWMGGHFRRCRGRLVETDAVTLPGNSGGPVLTDRGYLLGIHSRSERHMSSIEVAASEIYNIVNKLETARVLSIHNRTEFEINFQIRSSRDAVWSHKTIKPRENLIHWWYSNESLSPQISFDYDMSDEAEFKEYDLQTYTRPTIPGRLARERMSRQHDAREYHFTYYTERHEIDFHDSE